MSGPIKKKVMAIASQSNIARVLGVKPQTVSLWLNKGVPARCVIPLSEAIDWRVTPHELRPDMYPGVWDGLPESLRQRSNA